MNIGGFLAPLICGTLGELYGWHWGFGAAGVGMVAGLCIYLCGQRYLPPRAAATLRRSTAPMRVAPRPRTPILLLLGDRPRRHRVPRRL